MTQTDPLELTQKQLWERYGWQKASLVLAVETVGKLMRTRRQMGGEFPPPDDMTQWQVWGMKNDLEALLKEWDYQPPGQKEQ